VLTDGGAPELVELALDEEDKLPLEENPGQGGTIQAGTT
jgi:hypothetical protein